MKVHVQEFKPLGTAENWGARKVLSEGSLKPSGQALRTWSDVTSSVLNTTLVV